MIKRLSPPFLYGLFFALILIAPFFFSFIGLEGGGRYQVGILNDIGIYIILALSLNVILGDCGLFNMGHIAFFAIGAYTSAILSTAVFNNFSLPILWTMPIAGIVASLFAFIVTLPIIHLRGDYLLVVSIGIMEIVRIALVNNIFGITGGASGIYGIPRPEIFGYKISSPVQFYYLIWFFVALCVFLFSLLHNSRFGRALNYIKQDELAAEGMGINLKYYKVLSFMLGAFLAGAVGTLYAAKMRTIAPDAFNFSESVLLFAIVILGGGGSIPGVILGTFLLIGLPEALREFSSARMLFYGASMVLMMIFRPQGLLPPVKRKYFAKQFIGLYPTAKHLQSFFANERTSAGCSLAEDKKAIDQKDNVRRVL